MDLTPDQLRAARALLHLEQAELAERARVSVATIRRLESMTGRGHGRSMTFDGVRHALEQAGIEFIPDGVRRRRSSRPEADALLEELRMISLRSAALLQGHEPLTASDLYDEDGLPG